MVQIHPPQPNSLSSYGRRRMGALSISPKISPTLNLACTLPPTRPELQLRRIRVHNLNHARVASVSDRAARWPVALHQLQLDLDLKPLGVDRASREPINLPSGDFPARCEIQLYLPAQKLRRDSGFSRRSRMSSLEFRNFTPQLLTERQAANWLRISLPTLRRWRRAGRGPTFVRFARIIFYRLEDLEAFVTTHLSKQGSTS